MRWVIFILIVVLPTALAVAWALRAPEFSCAQQTAYINQRPELWGTGVPLKCVGERIRR